MSKRQSFSIVGCLIIGATSGQIFNSDSTTIKVIFLILGVVAVMGAMGVGFFSDKDLEN